MLARFCFVASLLCLAFALPQIENFNHPGHIPGEYLVVLKPAPSTETAQKAEYIQEAISKIKGISAEISLIDKFEELRSPILHLRTDDDQIISKAFQISDVVTIEANVQESKIEQCSIQNSGSLYWGLSRISSRSPPDYPDAQFSYRSNGGLNMRVYVLDTGIRTTHEDFSGGRAIFGTNTIGGGESDVNGHGTHCTGTILGGNSGVAKEALAVAVKVLDDNGSGTTASIVNGVNWVISDMQGRGRGVISMSLGGSASTTIDSAIQSAVSANIPVVVSAGNNNINACNQSPARSSAAITVGATDYEDNLSSYSNWGSCVDILAPGSDVLSASNADDSSYRYLSGTSMACPHVAGAAAVYLAQNPNAHPTQVMDYLTGSASEGYIDLRGTSGTPNLLLYENC